jgi:hypothetical protein
VPVILKSNRRMSRVKLGKAAKHFWNQDKKRLFLTMVTNVPSFSHHPVVNLLVTAEGRLKVAVGRNQG